MRRIVCIAIPPGPLPRLAAARPEPSEGGQREALLEWAAWCQRFSPTVGVEESPKPECLFLDITGLDRVFGGEMALAGKIVQDFADRGLAVRVVIADTLGAAWAVARFGARPSPARGSLQPKAAVSESGDLAVPSRPLARRANRNPLPASSLPGPGPSDRCPHPAAISRIPPGQSLLALKHLPVEALRLPRETVEGLHSLGIARIEELERLPREELSCRFGPRLVQRWDQALGRLIEPIPVQLPPPKFAVRRELEHPVASREWVALVLEQLVARLSEQLVGRGCGAVRLECRLECQEGEPVAMGVGLFQPTASPRHLSQLARMRLERASIPSPIVAISLEAPLVGPLEHRQEELFVDAPTRNRARLLAILIDRLASRLGRRSVLRARLLPEAQPELACRYDPWVSMGGGNAAGRAGGRFLQAGGEQRSRPSRAKRAGHEDLRGDSVPPRGVLPPRPLRLLRRPMAVSVISVAPHGPPFCFRLRGKEHRIAWTWGPERIETGWWRGRPVARDYYRVETADGHRFWLFRDLKDGRWFLHGNFA